MEARDTDIKLIIKNISKTPAVFKEIPVRFYDNSMALPTFLEVKTLSKLFPDFAGMPAMEFVTDFDETLLDNLIESSGREYFYYIEFVNGNIYKCTGVHKAHMIGVCGAAVDIKIIVIPKSAISDAD